jgi:xylulokinase
MVNDFDIIQRYKTTLGLKMSFILGIDLGTSSVKAILVSEGGEIIVSSSQGYPIYSPHPGWAEQEPEEWWESTIKAVGKAVHQSHTKPSQIKAVGLSGQTHGTVLVGKSLLPLRKAIIWMDQRSIAQTRWLQKRLGKRLSGITGLPVATGFMAPSLLWIRENEPRIWKKINQFLLPKDYIRLKLTGDLASDVTDAGGTLLLDTEKRKWSSEILQKLEIPANFVSPLYESCQISGKITKNAAKEISLKEGTPVNGGGADQIMGAVGNGIVETGRAACSIGTGGLVVTPMDHPRLAPDVGLHTIPHAIPGKWILMGAILSGGSSLNWFHRQVISGEEKNLKSENSYQSLFREVSPNPAASKGLIFLPYLKGERTPYLDPQAKGAFIGLNLQHNRRDLTRAIMEGVVFALRQSLEKFKELGIEITSVTTWGGGARNKIWQQIQADIFNLPILISPTQEGSAYGAAITATVSIGIFSTIKEACQEWIKIKGEILPISENVAVYNKAYRIYRGLYSKLKDDFHGLSKLAEYTFNFPRGS